MGRSNDYRDTRSSCHAFCHTIKIITETVSLYPSIFRFSGKRAGTKMNHLGPLALENFSKRDGILTRTGA